MKRIKSSQRGASFLSVVTIMIMVGSLLTIGFKLYPPFWDYKLIDSVITDVMANPEEIAKKPRDLRLGIIKRFRLNQIELPTDESLKIEKDQGVIVITLNYAVQVPMFMNVDALVKFDKRYEAVAP